MRLSYKLKDGRIASIAVYGLLRADAGKYPEFREQKASATVIDHVSKAPTQKVDIMISKDESGKYYFDIFGERIYVSTFLYLELEDLIDRLAKKESIPLSIFGASLIKNADNIAFVEKRWVPESISMKHDVRVYSGGYSKKPIVCIPMEKKFPREEWIQTIETIPADAKEQELYGVARYDMPTYHLEATHGNVVIIPRSDIKNYDFIDGKLYTKKR